VTGELPQPPAHQCGEVSLQKFQPCIFPMLTSRTTPKPLAELCTMVTGPPTAPFAGFELAVTLPVAVPLATKVSLKSVVPPMPHPDSGESGQLDRSSYPQRPVPSGLISITPEWPPPQCPRKGARCAARSVEGADWPAGGAGLPAGVEGGLPPPHAPRSVIAATHPSSAMSGPADLGRADESASRIPAYPFLRVQSFPRSAAAESQPTIELFDLDSSHSEHFSSIKIW
jgi:hypothetical protein